MRHAISVLLQNEVGALTRMTGMFSSRGYNIETLNVGPMPDSDLSRITATIIGDSSALDQAIKQLSKLVNVIEVIEYSKGQATERELLMLKIKLAPSQRTEIVQICEIFRAKIIDVAPNSVNVEMTGNPNKIKAFLNLVEPFGIIEMARTGGLALKRG